MHRKKPKPARTAAPRADGQGTTGSPRTPTSARLPHATAQVAQPGATDLSAVARVDSGLVASAYRKVMAKQDLSRDERAALRRHERAKEERLRWQYYSA